MDVKVLDMESKQGSRRYPRATFTAPQPLSRQVKRRAELKASKALAAKDGDRRNWRAVLAEMTPAAEAV